MRVLVTTLTTLALTAAACSGSDEASPITLVTYESFPTEETRVNELLDEFSAETGVEVEILVAGDTGTMLSKAELTAGNPEGDVMWGIDIDVHLTRDRVRGLRAVHRRRTRAVPDALTELVPNGEATPGRLRRRVHQLRHRRPRGSRSRSTERARRPRRPDLRRTCSSSRTRPPRRPASRSCSPRSTSTAKTDGRITGRAASTTVSGRRRVDRGLLRAVQLRRWRSAARRQLRVEPTVRGAVRRDRTRRRTDRRRRVDLLPPGRVRRRARRHRRSRTKPGNSSTS